MSKEWWGDDDKCGECLYNKYDNTLRPGKK